MVLFLYSIMILNFFSPLRELLIGTQTYCVLCPFLAGELQIEGTRLCTFDDEDGCLYNFTYRYLNVSSDGTPLYDIHVQNERQCPEPPNVLG